MAKVARVRKRPVQKTRQIDSTIPEQSKQTTRYDVSKHGFKPGESGNPAGRPKGSRNKLSEAFIADVLADWQQCGAAAVQNVRLNDPSTYLRVVAGLVPKEFKINEHDESALDKLLEQFSGTELDQLLVALASIGASQEGKQGKAASATGAKPNRVH